MNRRTDTRAKLQRMMDALNRHDAHPQENIVCPECGEFGLVFQDVTIEGTKKQRVTTLVSCPHCGAAGEVLRS